MTHYSASSFALAPRVACACLLAIGLVACASAPKPAPATVTPQPAAQPAPAPAQPAPPVSVKPEAPRRYVVKEGDTLWDIATRFLDSPWRWPDLWYVNPDIRNPHLIYPGDVIKIIYINGKPRLTLEGAEPNATKLEPSVHSTPLKNPIPTIPLSALQPFLSRSLILTEDDLQNAPYLLQPVDGRLVAASGTRVYVRGLKQSAGDDYIVVRKGNAYVDPGSGEVLGYAATYIGRGGVTRWGDPQTLMLNATHQEALRGDRLLPLSSENIEHNFTPSAPAKPVKGEIISVMGGVSQIGQYQVVVLDRGARDGLKPGDVMGIYRKGKLVDDPYAHGDLSGEVKLPEEKSGLLMVYRTFNKVSFGLVMQATSEIHILDIVHNP